MLLFLDLPINLTFGNFFLTFKVYAEAIGYFVDRRGYNSAIRRLLNVYSSTGKHKFRFIALEKITESFRMCLFFFLLKNHAATKFSAIFLPQIRLWQCLLKYVDNLQA